MKYATFELTSARARIAVRAVEENGGWWVRFGSELLVYSANAKWGAVSAKCGAAARATERPVGVVRKGDMHLVTQKGRTFQIENPDVPVIMDKGRYLVVDLSKAAAKKLAGRADPCFRIEPLRENSVVFEVPARREPPEPPDARVAAVVAALEPATFEAAITHLVSYPTRFSISSPYTDAADWSRGQLAALGLIVVTEPVHVGSEQSSNVIATKIGVGADGRGAVLVVAHLDSINHPGGPAAEAPGADDNASGSAGVLTLAKALAQHDFAHDLIFVLFGGEEQGLLGSTQYLASLPVAERQRIRAVLNMDMIGSINVTPPAVLLEGAAPSQDMIDALALSAGQFSALAVQTSLDPFASDHVPFIEAGIPAVLTIEGADGANEAIHTAHDTLDRVTTDFAIEILRMNLGYLATEAGVVARPVDWGCSAASETAPAMAQALNLLSAHYQALFAQYARLQRDGFIHAGDVANWQTARMAHDILMADSTRRSLSVPGT